MIYDWPKTIFVIAYAFGKNTNSAHRRFLHKVVQSYLLHTLRLTFDIVNVQMMRVFLRNYYKANNDDTANTLIDAGQDDYEIFPKFLW